MTKQFYWEPEGCQLVLYAADAKTRLGHVEPGGPSVGGWTAYRDGQYVNGSYSLYKNETKTTLLRVVLGVAA